MEWIKQRYDQFFLLLAALVLLAVSVLLFFRVLSFGDAFVAGTGQAPRTDEVPPLETATIDQALESLEKPQIWQPAKGSLFVSEKYIVRGGELVNVEQEMLHPPVPNEWLSEHGLDMLDPNVLEGDPDGDKFTNQEEWRAKTDPRDAEDHPPYVSKLRLVKEFNVPFRLMFKAYVGENAETARDFQIDTIDVRQPTQFVNIGQIIPATRYKVANFEHKTVTTGEAESPIVTDVSELTLSEVRLKEPVNGKADIAKLEREELNQLTAENIEETGKIVTLPKEKIVDSPDSYAVFRYLINGEEYRVQEQQIFTLPPEDIKYKFIDIEAGEAVIERVETGEKIKVPRLQ